MRSFNNPLIYSGPSPSEPESEHGRIPSGLYGMVDTSANQDLDHLSLGRALLDAGVRVLQLRMKGASTEEHLAVLSPLARMCGVEGAQLLVNDRLDVAKLLPAVGVHLGQGDAAPSEARRILGHDVLIGLSTHDLDQVHLACQLPVDYIGYGPVFSAAGKHHSTTDQRLPRDPVGLASLKRAVSEATVPVVAIGGVDLESLPLLVATGVHAVAVISAVTTAADCREAAEAFQRGFSSLS